MKPVHEPFKVRLRHDCWKGETMTKAIIIDFFGYIPTKRAKEIALFVKQAIKKE